MSTTRTAIARAKTPAAIGAFLATAGAGYPAWSLPAAGLMYGGLPLGMMAAAPKAYRIAAAERDMVDMWDDMVDKIGLSSPRDDDLVQPPVLLEVDFSHAWDLDEPRASIWWQPRGDAEAPVEEYPMWSHRLAYWIGGAAAEMEVVDRERGGPVLRTDVALRLREAPPALRGIPLTRPGEFYFGIGNGSRPITWEPLNGGSVHTLIGAETGGGKSNLLRIIASQVYGWNGWRVVVCDPINGGDFAWMKRAPYADKGVLVDDARACRVALAEVAAEVRRRASILGQTEILRPRPDGTMVTAEATTIHAMTPEARWEMGQGSAFGSDNVLVVVDEARQLITGGSSKDEKTSTSIAREAVETIATLARRVGIHMVMATQRAEVDDVLTGRIRQNLAGRVLMGLPDANSTKMLLDGRIGIAPDWNIEGSQTPGLMHFSGLRADDGKNVRMGRAPYFDETLLSPIPHTTERVEVNFDPDPLRKAAQGKPTNQSKPVGLLVVGLLLMRGVSWAEGWSGERAVFSGGKGCWVVEAEDSDGWVVVGHERGARWRALTGKGPALGEMLDQSGAWDRAQKRGVGAWLSRVRLASRSLRYVLAKPGRVGERDPRLWMKYLKDHNRRCECCHAKGRVFVDHIRPHALHGTDDFSNLQALCNDCHGFKTNVDLMVINFAKWVAKKFKRRRWT